MELELFFASALGITSEARPSQAAPTSCAACRFLTDLYFQYLYVFSWLFAKGRSRSTMATLWVRQTERQITHLLWKLAWLSIFVLAKKSLFYWTNEMK